MILQVSNERSLCEELVTNFVRDSKLDDTQKALVRELVEELNKRAKECTLAKREVYKDVKTKEEVQKIWKDEEAALALR